MTSQPPLRQEAGLDDAFQHFPASARSLRTAVLQRRNEVLEDSWKLWERLKIVGEGWEFLSIKATLSGFDLKFVDESKFFPELQTVSWVPFFEDDNWNRHYFGREHWPEEMRVTEDEVQSFNRLLEPQWREVEDAFLDAALEGREVIYAREGSPVERRVTRIPPDVWANFEVVDWKTGRARVPHSEHLLYGVCSVAVGAGKGDGPASFEQALALLTLENEKRISSSMPPLTIADTEAWAHRNGYSREVARALRNQLPERLKLRPGEKKKDRRSGPPA